MLRAAVLERGPFFKRVFAILRCRPSRQPFPRRQERAIVLARVKRRLRSQALDPRLRAMADGRRRDGGACLYLSTLPSRAAVEQGSIRGREAKSGARRFDRPGRALPCARTVRPSTGSKRSVSNSPRFEANADRQLQGDCPHLSYSIARPLSVRGTLPPADIYSGAVGRLPIADARTSPTRS